MSWALILFAGAAAALVFFLARSQTPIYQATTRLIAAQPTSFQGGQFSTLGSNNPLDSQAYREAALSGQVLRDALNLPDNADPSALKDFRERVRVRTQDGRLSGIIVLSVRDESPTRAAQIANAWSAALRRWEDNRVRAGYSRYRVSLEAQLRSLQADINRPAATQAILEGRRTLQANLLRDLDLVRALEQGATGQLSLLDTADRPVEPVAPRPVLAGVLAGFLAFALGVLVLLLREISVRNVRGSEDASQLTGLPILGEFPKVAGLANRDLPREPASYLRTYVNRSLMDEDPKIVAVTSPEAKEGKSSVSIALARAYARTGKRTLLIDLDLHKPVLHTAFGIKVGPDVISVLRDPLFNMAAHPVERGLSLLPCLQVLDDPSGLLTEQFRPFLRRLRESGEWDAIIIDTAPVFEVTDPLVIAPQVSGVVLVVSAGSTNRRRLVAALDSLRRIGAKVLGVAVNGVRAGEGMLISAKGYSYKVPRQDAERDPTRTAEY